MTPDPAVVAGIGRRLALRRTGIRSLHAAMVAAPSMAVVVVALATGWDPVAAAGIAILPALVVAGMGALPGLRAVAGDGRKTFRDGLSAAFIGCLPPVAMWSLTFPGAIAVVGGGLGLHALVMWTHGAVAWPAIIGFIAAAIAVAADGIGYPVVGIIGSAAAWALGVAAAILHVVGSSHRILDDPTLDAVVDLALAGAAPSDHAAWDHAPPLVDAVDRWLMSSAKAPGGDDPWGLAGVPVAAERLVARATADDVPRVPGALLMRTLARLGTGS